MEMEFDHSGVFDQFVDRGDDVHVYKKKDISIK